MRLSLSQAGRFAERTLMQDDARYDANVAESAVPLPHYVIIDDAAHILSNPSSPNLNFWTAKTLPASDFHVQISHYNSHV